MVLNDPTAMTFAKAGTQGFIPAYAAILCYSIPLKNLNPELAGQVLHNPLKKIM